MAHKDPKAPHSVARSRRRGPVRMTLLSPKGEALPVAEVVPLERGERTKSAPAASLRVVEGGAGKGAAPKQLSLGLRPTLASVPPWADNPSVVMPRGLRTWRDEADHHGPDGPQGEIESAIALLRAAAQAERVGVRGDALLVAIEHLARALGDLFDPEVARAHLRAILGRV